MVNKLNINSINGQDKVVILKEYCDLFQGVGQFQAPLQLQTQPNAQVVVRPPCRVLHVIMNRLAEKLKRKVW